MHRLLISIAAIAVLALVWSAPADAKYVSGAVVAVGGDGGSANQADVFGDIVASYTSSLGSDTQFKTNIGANLSASITSVFGDTAGAIGAATLGLSPGGVANFTLAITNYANVTDNIKIKTDTAAVTGAAKDSVTIKVNGVTIYQNGNDSYAAFTLSSIPPGAETQVTITISHDTPGALGLADAVIKTLPNNGVGGDSGGYGGFNGDSHAGDGNANVTFGVNGKDVNIRLALDTSAIISAPTSYAGLAVDTVPGAKVEYTIRYDNDGNDTGVGFTIKVRIPQFTTLGTAANGDSATAFPHTGALATITITDTAGVVVGDTDPAAAMIKWTFNLGVGPTNGDNAGTVDAVSPDVDAGYVRFRVYIK